MLHNPSSYFSYLLLSFQAHGSSPTKFFLPHQAVYNSLNVFFLLIILHTASWYDIKEMLIFTASSSDSSSSLSRSVSQFLQSSISLTTHLASFSHSLKYVLTNQNNLVPAPYSTLIVPFLVLLLCFFLFCNAFPLKKNSQSIFKPGSIIRLL